MEFFEAFVVLLIIFFIGWQGCEAEMRDADTKLQIQRLEQKIDALERGRNAE